MDKGIIISRVFDAPKEKVWKAWTDPEKIKEWWGPKDFTAPSIKIDFKERGKYLYCMHGPKDTEYDRDFWSAGFFEEIIPLKKIVATDHFSDKDGNIVDPTAYGMDKNFPKELTVIIELEDAGDNMTKLIIKYPKLNSDEEFEAMKKSGMEEGWNQSLDKLEQLLKSTTPHL